ncbi:hypothetical protein KJ765_01945 [Candidatus Micrarchaeota archaeon]|nr:hypothetical protein [Candidatus Micrarchaeota archaeon]
MEGKKWYLIFYDIKGSKAFAKSTFRSKISRVLSRTTILPLQQSVWAIESTEANKEVVDKVVDLLKAQNAKVLLFEGWPTLPSTHADVNEMVGSRMDQKYEILKGQVLDLKSKVKKAENREKRKREFASEALKLRRKFDRLVTMDPRDMISNNRTLIEGEFFDLEKEINELP